MTSAYISQLEQGQRENPSKQLMMQIAKELNVNPEALRGLQTIRGRQLRPDAEVCDDIIRMDDLMESLQQANARLRNQLTFGHLKAYRIMFKYKPQWKGHAHTIPPNFAPDPKEESALVYYHEFSCENESLMFIDQYFARQQFDGVTKVETL